MVCRQKNSKPLLFYPRHRARSALSSAPVCTLRQAAGPRRPGAARISQGVAARVRAQEENSGDRWARADDRRLKSTRRRGERASIDEVAMALRATDREESRRGAGRAGLQTRAGPPGPAPVRVHGRGRRGRRPQTWRSAPRPGPVLQRDFRVSCARPVFARGAVLDRRLKRGSPSPGIKKGRGLRPALSRPTKTPSVRRSSSRVSDSDGRYHAGRTPEPGSPG
jgi:hypothetical protein